MKKKRLETSSYDRPCRTLGIHAPMIGEQQPLLLASLLRELTEPAGSHARPAVVAAPPMGRRSKSTHASGATRYSLTLIQLLGPRCAGPGGSAAFTRTLLLRTLRLPLPAAARVCREVAALLATDVFLHDLNLDVPLSDGRQIKVVAMACRHLAAPTLMSRWYLPCNGTELAGPALEPGKALREAEERKRRTTYPELAAASWCRFAARLVGDGRQRLRISSPALRVEKPLPARPASARLRPGRLHAAGPNCSRSPPRAHLAPACSSSSFGGPAAGDVLTCAGPRAVPRSLGFRSWFVRVTFRQS